MNASFVIVLNLLSAVLSGMGVVIFASIRENKLEKARKAEKEQDSLKIELKDLQIKLYKVEKDLDDWKQKYYSAIQELISVKAELEETLIKLSLIHMDHEEDLA